MPYNIRWQTYLARGVQLDNGVIPLALNLTISCVKWP
jgi:hypothetical protein